MALIILPLFHQVPKEDDQLVKAFAEWMEIAAQRGTTVIILVSVTLNQQILNPEL